MDKETELLSKLLLHRRRGFLVWDIVKTSGGDFGSEPVGFRESDCEGNEVLFDLLWGKLFADLV